MLDRKLPEVLIITGLSGSGMSSAMKAFEDLGYFCVDNLPVTLLPVFSRLLLKDVDDERVEKKTAIERAALVINIREGGFFADLPEQLENLKKQGLRVFTLFLEATDEVLLRRFSETRRPHPADNGRGLQSAIAFERETLNVAREIADLIIDTSSESVHDLRRHLVERFNDKGENLPLRVNILSFGHKYGTPRDVDLMFDVRHLPNPFFVEELKDFSGNHKKVIKFLRSHEVVLETIKRFADLLKYLLPHYKVEGKSYVTVGIGCTGGRHRSVMVANSLAKELLKAGFDSQSTHRDSKKAAKRGK
ncbi:MAG: RNase adapter RapZ [Pyrinomonadaceae bacterium]|nr:RNase adapter RapZ [Pyrinomonadaceae bacterium]